MEEIKLNDIKVMYVESTSGPAGAQAAFDKLEAHFPNLKGRKFYGMFQYPDCPYGRVSLSKITMIRSS